MQGFVLDGVVGKNGTGYNESDGGDMEEIVTPGASGRPSAFPGKPLIIPLYTLIFLLSFIGNFLVILTLAKNRRMVTITNVFLLNLAISDLLLGVFCMPATLIGQLLQNFVFGSFMCKIIPYFQAVSVSVGVWTLVAISIERYFAICRPLHSRKWQTKSHAYKIIIMIWILTIILNLPITLVSQLQPIGQTGRSKCREAWPTRETEKGFNVILGALLLVVPLGVMVFSYSLIVSKLWKGLKKDIRSRAPYTNNYQLSRQNSVELNNQSHSAHSFKMAATTSACSNEIIILKGGKGMVVRWKRKTEPVPGGSESGDRSVSIRKGSNLHPQTILQLKQTSVLRLTSALPHPMGGGTLQNKPGVKLSRAIRSSYTEKSIESKKKVIRMLFVLVAEFFICWTPLYVMHLCYLFMPEAVYKVIGPLGVTLIQLLAYSSSCSNPITYCFMNRRFRLAFIKLVQSVQKPKKIVGPLPTIERPSDLSANDSLIFALRGSTGKSEAMVVDCDEPL